MVFILGLILEAIHGVWDWVRGRGKPQQRQFYAGDFWNAGGRKEEPWLVTRLLVATFLFLATAGPIIALPVVAVLWALGVLPPE